MRAFPAAIGAAVVVALLANPASADGPDADHGYQTWLAAFAHGPIARKAWLWTDAHLRLYDAGGPSAVLLRPGVSYKARPALYLTAGYAWTPSWPRPDGTRVFTDEHRVWQQIMWTPRSERRGTAAIVRARLEQRFRPGAEPGTGVRGRLMWRGQRRLAAGRPFIGVVWNEVFFGLNDTAWGQRFGVDQNRLFVGVGWQIKPTVVRLEVGYTNVWLVRPGPDPVAHVVAFNTFWGWPPARR